MNVFSIQPGRTFAVPAPEAVPMVLSFDDWNGYHARRAIVQSVGVASQGNYQFLHTLRNFVYVYVFGERMGEITLSGLAFAGHCPFDTTDGTAQVMSYYAQKGISYTGAPVGIQIGAAGFRGFLTAAKFDIINPKGRIGQFTFRFNTLPPVR